MLLSMMILKAAAKPAPSVPPLTGPPLTIQPAPGDLPGHLVIQHLTNGLGWWALVAAMVGIILGAIVWAFGHYSQNYQQAYNGRRGVMVSAAAALLIGGAPHIIRWFLQEGTTFG